MKLTWRNQNVTTPSEIESHNNMVETLWKWRHAGLVIESEAGESLPELIDTPKRVLRCECGNDDLHLFTLLCLSDVGVYSLNRYENDGRIEATHQDTDCMPANLAEELGLARKGPMGVSEDGTEYQRYQWLWILSCDKCKGREKIWSNELDEIIEWN